MDADQYGSTRFGRAQRTGGRHGHVAYFPNALPHRLDLAGPTIHLLAEAEAALGRLSGVGRLLPNPHLLVRPYLFREAIASTRIEGTQASLPQVLEVEAFGTHADPDVEEVVNYVRAMDRGVELLESLPLSVRLMRELHAILLDGVRGRDRRPGEIRRRDNWIGPPGATLATALFVPPPHESVPDLLADWERVANGQTDLPLLIECALLHYQFETIHPFLDGNGRLGRLLIVFFLIARGRLPHALLYLSPYFERHRTAYYERLQAVRERGDVHGWLDFFLVGVSQQANDAVARAEQLMDLREDYRRRVVATTRSQAPALVDLAFELPLLTSTVVVHRLGVTRPTALALLEQLADLEILAELLPGPRRQRRWRAGAILEALEAEERER